MRMITNGTRTPTRPAFHDVEEVDGRTAGINALRQEFGSIDGQTDEQFLTALAATGVTVLLQDVARV